MERITNKIAHQRSHTALQLIEPEFVVFARAWCFVVLKRKARVRHNIKLAQRVVIKVDKAPDSQEDHLQSANSSMINK